MVIYYSLFVKNIIIIINHYDIGLSAVFKKHFSFMMLSISYTYL